MGRLERPCARAGHHSWADYPGGSRTLVDSRRSCCCSHPVETGSLRTHVGRCICTCSAPCALDKVHFFMKQPRTSHDSLRGWRSCPVVTWACVPPGSLPDPRHKQGPGAAPLADVDAGSASGPAGGAAARAAARFFGRMAAAAVARPKSAAHASLLSTVVAVLRERCRGHCASASQGAEQASSLAVCMPCCLVCLQHCR